MLTLIFTLAVYAQVAPNSLIVQARVYPLDDARQDQARYVSGLVAAVTTNYGQLDAQPWSIFGTDHCGVRQSAEDAARCVRYYMNKASRQETTVAAVAIIVSDYSRGRARLRCVGAHASLGDPTSEIVEPANAYRAGASGLRRDQEAVAACIRRAAGNTSH